MNWKTWTFGILGMACLVSPARSERVLDGLADVTVIEDGEGHARILFNWNAPIDAEHFAIRRALLRFDLAGAAESRKIRLMLHPLTKAWDPSDVTWMRGWSKPGGDFDPNICSRFEMDLGRGSGPAGMDITNVVKDVLESRDFSYGLLLTTEPAGGIGIRVEDLPRFSALSNASVDVSWRKTPPPPTDAQ